MAVTPKGIYYPTGEDAANWATIFQTMANSIDSALGDFTYDSGWIPITNFQNGWQSYWSGGNTQASYRRVGKIVHCASLIRNGTAFGVLFRVPTGFVSKTNNYFSALANTGASVRIDVLTNGNIAMHGSGTPSGYYSLSNITYVAG